MYHKVNWEDKGVYIQFKGVIDLTQFISASHEIESDKRFKDIQYVINDFLNVDQFLVTEKEAELFSVREKSRKLSHVIIKMAFITTKPEIKQLCEIYIENAKLIKIPWEYNIFSSIEEMREWIEQ